MKVGDKVLVTEIGDEFQGETGTLVENDGSAHLPWKVKFEGGEFRFTWYDAWNLDVVECDANETESTEYIVVDDDDLITGFYDTYQDAFDDIEDGVVGRRVYKLVAEFTMTPVVKTYV